MRPSPETGGATATEMEDVAEGQGDERREGPYREEGEHVGPAKSHSRG